MARHRIERINAIGSYFAGLPLDPHDHMSVDAVAFQELWVKDDYARLKQALKVRFPFSHRYKSGVVGSGLAIFSVYPIVRTWWLEYGVHGKIQRVFDGDWFAGKGIAAARIEHPHAGPIEIFNTHVHTYLPFFQIF